MSKVKSTKPTTTVEPTLLRVRDVADQLSISVGAVYALARSGELPSARIGVSVRISSAGLREWIARNVSSAGVRAA